jgi:hypothetical protein
VPSQGAPGGRGAYTLLEMLLVVTIVVVAASLVVPSVIGIYERSAIEEAAQQVGVQLRSARLRAIDTGVAYRFRLQVGGRGYIAEPAETPGAATEDSADTCPTITGEVPEGMQFEEVAARPLMVAAAPEAVAGSAEASAWSLAALFLPDGSAIDSEFAVADSHENSIRFSLRGLTGGLKVGQPEMRASQ